MKYSFLCAVILSITGSAYAAADGNQESNDAWQKGVSDSLNETKSLNFQKLQEGVRGQAEAVIGNIQTSQIAESLHIADSPAVTAMSERLNRAHKGAIEATDESMVAKAKAALPKIADALYRGPKSPYFTTSPRGQDVITVIRAIPQASGDKRRELLLKIKQYSSAGFPEAVNFVGFIFEYGLFGAKKDGARALNLYQSAAATGYQPALYNVANYLYYGKGGVQDTSTADDAIRRAYMMAQDTSGRICGLGAFINYRSGNKNESLRYATGCTSTLAKLPMAIYEERMLPLERIRTLKETLGTGADDAFPMMRRIADSMTKIDPQLKCRYELMDRYRLNTDTQSAKAAATQCLNKSGTSDGNGRMSQDIANYVDVEIRSIQSERQRNQFHYSWSVPYLPFPMTETGQFLPLIEHKQQ
ncbi:sel1 repeat family protein [Herbaspirillum sp. RV1423]|uniref:sel1 repeat family protein n=1 Tax=Herbaspirillum sp. RV1423 TaxID=1443993 RepID=UPI0004B31505|nr:sel1 repeat family protein [Herbaspirillum sp. RV1423]